MREPEARGGPGQGGPRILAISSGGGHWVQLCRALPAFEGAEIVFVTIDETYREDLPHGARLHVVADATRWDRWRLLWCAAQLVWVMLRERPDVVFTTGAAPGGIALVLGRLTGARTIWLDSVANIDQISMTGRRAGRWADLWLTQWAHLEGTAGDGPEYAGSVL